MSETEKKRGVFGRLFGGGRTEPQAEPKPPAPIETVKPDTAQASAPEQEEAAQAAPAKGGWLQRLKSGLSKTSARLTDGIAAVFTKRKLDEDTLQDLEDLLIGSDLGLDTTERILNKLKESRYDKAISPDEVREVLRQEVENVLRPVARPLVLQGRGKPEVILCVGVNGSGKTTTIGKLASRFRAEGKSVSLVAGDTFRAAAIDQLKVWGERVGAPVISRPVGSDAAGLAFDALTEAQTSGVDVLIVDTAGRLQNKQGLMEELEKIVRVMRKVAPDAPHHVLLVLDATTGQNALNQVEVFEKMAGVSGLVMTKLDGTARGGILVAISARFHIPVVAIGVGEGVDDLQAFDASQFARAIASG